MNGLFRAISRALGRSQRDRLEDLYSSAGDRDELLSSVEQAAGVRKRTTNVVGPFVSSDARAWDEEHVDYVDERGVQTTVTHRDNRRCDCGAVLGGNTYVLGTCVVCGSIVCTREGCAGRCERCGAVACRRHTCTFRGHEFCSGHRLYAYWRLFWGVLQ